MLSGRGTTLHFGDVLQDASASNRAVLSAAAVKGNRYLAGTAWRHGGGEGGACDVQRVTGGVWSQHAWRRRWSV